MTHDLDLILAHMISRRAAETPHLDVLTFVEILPDGSFAEEVRTYGQLWANGLRMAEALIEESGMNEGDKFALIMQNHPEFIDAMVGSSIANTVFVPIDPRTKGALLRYMIDYAECRGVVCADYALAHLLDGVLAELPRIEWVWVIDTGLGLKLPEDRRFRWWRQALDRTAGHVVIRANNPAEPMQMLYTSGTTGNPKAILAPHARFGGVAQIGQLIGLTPADRPYTGLSLTHANAQLVTLGCTLKMGLRTVISRKFTKSRLWDITRRYGCTVFNLLGGMTMAIYSEPERPDDADNPVRYVLSAGMPAVIWEKFETRFGLQVFEFYGLAEGGLTFNPPGHGPVGSVGKPPPNMLCTIRDDADQECPDGEPGEICFRFVDGSLPAFSYFKNAEATGERLRDGWFRTGDIGRKDAEGWLYFEYRKGGGIRRNGDFVTAATVEKVIAEYPLIDDVFVYGLALPTNTPGEKEIVAAVRTADAAGFDPKDLMRHCKGQLPANFLPGFIQVVPEIPKTASEKPQERFLVEAFHNNPEQVHRMAAD
ncbi:MAG TPA: AMP-binding protein [Rhodospirillaceae bacterium]|nr:AMP-binding protein [Rhodospirillaceae bacterium]